MEESIDLTTDPLAKAAFTPEQRKVWETVRSELIAARGELQGQKERIKALEEQTLEEGFIHSVLSRPDFNREVARMLAFDERYGGLSSVLYFDIENLSEIIANNGSAVGNAAVRCVCDILVNHVRRSDILGRLAIDEFGVLLPRCDNPSAWSKGEKIAEMLQQALSEIDSGELKPIISFGAYTFREHEDLATGLKLAASAVTRVSAGEDAED